MRKMTPMPLVICILRVIFSRRLRPVDLRANVDDMILRLCKGTTLRIVLRLSISETVMSSRLIQDYKFE